MRSLEEIKKLLEHGYALPYKKSSSKWGIRGSSLLDRKTEEECYFDYYKYLEEHGLIWNNK